MHEGLECYSPRVRLSKSHVERILKNPFYTGSFLWNGVLYKGTHSALVSRDLFEQVGQAMRNRQRGNTASEHLPSAACSSAASAGAW